MGNRRSLVQQVSTHRIGLLLGLIVIVGTVLRLIQANESVSGDELSTLWIVSNHSLGGTIDLVSGDAEITPPLNFILSWFAVQLGSTPELVRLPALISGIVSIPLLFVLGRKTINERAGLIGAAILALSPLMIYFSGNGRAYTLMVALLIGSTIAMLKADETGRARWWVAYGGLTCLAMYSHYTAMFVLLAQLVWLLWLRPGSRRPAILANVGAVIFFLPWVSGMRSDLSSPTTDVLQALQGHGFDAKLTQVKGWAFGHPFLDADVVPGEIAMAIITLALVVATVLTVRKLRESSQPATAPKTSGNEITSPGGDFVARSPGSAGLGDSWRGIPSGLILAFLIAIATPLGELVLNLAGTDIFGARNMAPSWYGFALVIGAVLSIPTGLLATACAVVVIGGYAFAAADILRPENRVVGFKAPAKVIDEESDPGDVVVDMLASLTTPVPLTALDAAMSNDLPLYSPNHPTSQPPFLPKTVVITPIQDDLEKAFNQASGHRVFMYAQDWVPVVDNAESGRNLDQVLFENYTVYLPKNAKIVEQTTYEGVPNATLYVIDVE